jgi:hypothetical protein
MTEDQTIKYCESLGFSRSDFTTTINRGWHDDNWDETVTDWEAIGKLIHEIYEQPRADHDMLRVNGDLECWNCGKPYWKHPDNLYYRDQEGQPYLKDLCGGILGKL